MLTATAIACGGTSVGDPSMMGAGGSGDGGRNSNPPMVGVGGSTPIYPNPGAGAGPILGGAAGGQGTGHPLCPSVLPLDGTFCSEPGPMPQYHCDYPAPCGFDFAVCTTNSWHAHFESTDCIAGEPGVAGGGPIDPIPPQSLTCPGQIPAPGTFCYKPPSISSYRCDYPGVCFGVEATCTGIWDVQAQSIECAGAGGQFDF
jgi:hypothetical protein